MTKEPELIHDLTEGSVPKQLISFATPLFLSGLLQTVYNAVDMIVVGQYVGSVGLSAVSIGGEVLNLLTFVAMGFSSAGQIILSQYVGAKRRDRVRPLVGTLFTTMLVSAVVLTALCLLMRASIFRWLNTPQEALADVGDYVVVCCLGLVFIYGYNLVSAILRGLGDSKHPFLFVAIASLVNLGLDFLFIAGFGWGVAGAALATVIGQGVSFVWSICFLYRKREQLDFDFKLSSFRVERPILVTLLKLGVPLALQIAAITFSKLVITSWINGYGVVASALTGVANKIATFLNVFTQALSTAGGTMIAQSIGAEKYHRVPRIIGVALVVSAALAVPFSLATFFFPRAVFGVFTKDEAVLALAMTYVPIALLQYASCVLRSSLVMLINGSGNAKLNLAIGLIDGVIARIGLAMLLGFTCRMGIYGFWYGNTLAGFVPFFIGGGYYLSGRWKTRKYIIGK